MRYPKEIGPQSNTEALAILFSMLGNAYNVIAQYEAEELKREQEDRRRKVEDMFNMPNAEGAGAHQKKYGSVDEAYSDPTDCAACGAGVDETHAADCQVWAAMRDQ